MLLADSKTLDVQTLKGQRRGRPWLDSLLYKQPAFDLRIGLPLISNLPFQTEEFQYAIIISYCCIQQPLKGIELWKPSPPRPGLLVYLSLVVLRLLFSPLSFIHDAHICRGYCRYNWLACSLTAFLPCPLDSPQTQERGSHPLRLGYVSATNE